MTKDEIIEMAKQSGCEIRNGHIYNQYIGSLDQVLKRFAKLVAEKEREMCAKICDERVTAYQYATDVWAKEHINEAKHLSQAIRARGKE
jgi:hypothetical protein